MPTEATPDRHTEVAASRTAEAAERTKETPVPTTVAAQRTEASADRRTELAANRTVLAAERSAAARANPSHSVGSLDVATAFYFFTSCGNIQHGCPAWRNPAVSFCLDLPCCGRVSTRW
jgi:hypothetical protein